MRFSSIISVAIAGATIAAALPMDLTNFLLVTTSQEKIGENSSELKAVSATSLFDPFHQPALLLRLTGPGYGSLPNFTLTDGTLSTISAAPFGNQMYRYNSTRVTAGSELQFLASVQPTGNIELDAGYLLTVDGQREGWTICEGVLDAEVLSWMGNATDCTKTYVHAVLKAPY
ncbi:hypothetical protein A1F94_009792 [Pyrenophora tritici-repentis]|uniref:Uncharacterized protein n=2 Tax=Pyrenophora tritici-repentis TaxID=45151 RepID=A0A2W1DQB0_9PLEO|nr:uncharacterized protein PTRG_08335 [Pyrenophora tritici-repentis Pt-1C-BFP]KAF7443697.1 hypothetical protein A1F99_117710 [Pyrenophora tritici-repentis]EDU51254.1 conserved hypothetical protein [Pyrenophora tritici-repentis Pt-1C-BFP]KAG9379436.1 hypothetical protein A1F94_009792 [Pyrenophora tritici-repentis]KAI0575567.1 hypothetical protein Alg215_07935 [Pyrenophora tritici-repentis]KAI0587922.1 hypothetical protein Alg130_03609 [Pyrenophora tritici-repentis]